MKKYQDTTLLIEFSEKAPSIERLKTFLAERILPDLERGRPELDAPHTLAVVSKIEAITDTDPSLDKHVMLIAAYAHDWGYTGLFGGGRLVQADEIKKVKPLHMELGAKKVAKLLEDGFFNYLDRTRKSRIIHLVAVHDTVKNIPSPAADEITLLEADVLGACDVSMVKPTFNRESNDRWVRNVREVKRPKFIHQYAREECDRLLAEREAFYASNYPD